MKDIKEKKKNPPESEDKEVDRRKFIEKSARDLGACGFALYDIAKTIKNEIIQGVVDEIKDVIKKP